MVDVIKKKKKKKPEDKKLISPTGEEETLEERKARIDVKPFLGGVPATKEEFSAATGGRGPLTPLVRRALGSGEFAPVAQREREEELRREGFEEATGAGGLRQELKGKIAQPPSIQPEPLAPGLAQGILGEIGAPIGIAPAQFSQAARLLENPEKELKSVGIKVAAGSAVGLGLPFLSQLFARGSMVKAVLGNKGVATALATVTTGLGIFVVGPGIFDFRGDEMETHRKIIQSVIEVGERIEAANRNNEPITSPDTIELLRAISDEVDFAEQRIQELGIYNFEYKVAKEYLEDMTRIRSARIAIERRIGAVINTAVTGQAALRPEQLLYETEQLKDLES